MRSLHGLMVLFMILGVSCLLLCSCAEETVTDTGEITFTDALGRTVVLDSIPQRTASLSGSLAEIWMLAGGTLCAAAEDAWDDVSLELGDALCIGGAQACIFEGTVNFTATFNKQAGNIAISKLDNEQI